MEVFKVFGGGVVGGDSFLLDMGEEFGDED